jgi:hypothetical protein
MSGDLCKGGEERDNIIVEFGCLSCVEVREPSQIVDEMIDHLSLLMKRWMPKRVEEMRRWKQQQQNCKYL